jgi:membrane fusion protein (multidrug efflux system)
MPSAGYFKRFSNMNAVSKIEGDVANIEAEALEKPVVVTAAVQSEPEIQVPRRRKGRLALMVAVPLALIVGGGYVWVTGGRYQETENANLRQARVSIASETAGRIVSVNVSDNGDGWCA